MIRSMPEPGLVCCLHIRPSETLPWPNVQPALEGWMGLGLPDWKIIRWIPDLLLAECAASIGRLDGTWIA